MPIHKGKYLHELALRILLQSLESQANKYGRHIVPVASFGIDFYIRCFVRVFDSKKEVKNSSLKIGYVYQSTGCPTFEVVPSGSHTGKTYVPTVVNAGEGGRCPETGKSFKVGGPFWIAPIHNQAVVEEAVKRVEMTRDYGQYHDPLPTSKRLHGLLTTVSEELPDVPLYYLLPDLASTLRCQIPPRGRFIAQLTELGYRSSATHKEPDALKTDAPTKVLWDIMRNWVKLHPIADKRSKDAADAKGKGVTPGMLILEKEPEFECNFKGSGREEAKARKKAARYPLNPEANWGPKRAAGRFASKRSRDGLDEARGGQEEKEEGKTEGEEEGPDAKKTRS